MDGLGQLDGIGADGLTLFFRQEQRRREFDDLLMASLDGAVPFKEMDHVTVGIAQDLDFHVFGFFQIFFHEDRAVAKGLGGFTDRRMVFLEEVLFLTDDTHPPAAAAGRRLEDDRISRHLGVFNGFRVGGDGFFHPGNGGNLDGFGQQLGLDLIPHLFHHFMGGSDEFNARFMALAHEDRIFRQKSITRMDGIHILFQSQGDDLVHIQVSLDRPCRPRDQIRLISLASEEGHFIFLGVYGHCPDAQLMTGTDDPDGDFPRLATRTFLIFFITAPFNFSIHTVYKTSIKKNKIDIYSPL